MSGSMKGSKNVQAMLNAQIAELDEKISKQLNEILHNEEFQKLEAAWRGLGYLVDQTETNQQLKIKVMNVSKETLIDDLAEAPDFDQSAIWTKIYEEEFGQLGGHPFSILVGDYEFSRHPQDMFLLRKMATVAAGAHAPFLSAASPEMFGWDDYTQLTKHRDLSTIFGGDDSIEWNSFRESEDSRYVALSLPHILMRLPYGPNTKPVKGFSFKEDVDGTNHKKYLWGNAAYALAARVTAAYARYHWCSAIRGVEGGGLVEGLPLHVFQTDEGTIASKCPTEIAISDRRENQFSELGFLPLLYRKHSDEAAFIGGQTANKPKFYGNKNPEANANAQLSAQLPYLLSVSRFAHYIKSMVRDKIGAPMSRSQLELYLNNWINEYVTSDDNAPLSVKAELPLREASVEVVEVKGKPGTYKAVGYLRPHFMLDQVHVRLSLVAELPQQQGGG
jgi:type VI secretion system protein ImpC